MEKDPEIPILVVTFVLCETKALPKTRDDIINDEHVNYYYYYFNHLKDKARWGVQ